MTREEIQNILSKVDHTYLKPDATHDDIEKLCREAMKYKTASVCIPSFYLKFAKALFEHLAKQEADKLGCDVSDIYRPKLCTVIGFPCGNILPSAKFYEAKEALLKGADEIDMVINIGLLKDVNSDISEKTKILAEDALIDEINQIKDLCGDKILKVIVENCLLTKEEKILACKVVSKSKADYIKTSTGFSTGGATFDDVRLMKENVFNNTKIKAAGGISGLEDAQKFIELGADRLGTSRVVKEIIKQEQENDKSKEDDGLEY